MNIIAIIPARMGSSRFPGKPLALINGIPMVEHVYRRTSMSKKLAKTWIATCDEEIMNFAKEQGFNAVMTADTHERCSDRTAEAMLKIEEQTGKSVDVVVMVQGDEPLVTPTMIDQSIEAILSNDEAGLACLMGQIHSDEEFRDYNKIKVVTDKKLKALFMSREPIPTSSKGVEVDRYKQVCIIPFKRDYLIEFNDMSETNLEISESIDLNRVLEHGGVVQMAITEDVAVSVDVLDDITVAEKALETDKWIGQYNE